MKVGEWECSDGVRRKGARGKRLAESLYEGLDVSVAV